MAKVAAGAVAGNRDTRFRGADMSTKLKLLGVDVASVGDAHGRARGATTYTYIDERDHVYKRIVVNKTGKKLLGAVLVGDTDDYGMLLQTMQNELALPKHPTAPDPAAARGRRHARRCCRRTGRTAPRSARATTFRKARS